MQFQGIWPGIGRLPFNQIDVQQVSQIIISVEGECRWWAKCRGLIFMGSWAPSPGILSARDSDLKWPKFAELQTWSKLSTRLKVFDFALRSLATSCFVSKGTPRAIVQPRVLLIWSLLRDIIRHETMKIPRFRVVGCDFHIRLRPAQLSPDRLNVAEFTNTHGLKRVHE